MLKCYLPKYSPQQPCSLRFASLLHSPQQLRCCGRCLNAACSRTTAAKLLWTSCLLSSIHHSSFAAVASASFFSPPACLWQAVLSLPSCLPACLLAGRQFFTTTAAAKLLHTPSLSSSFLPASGRQFSYALKQQANNTTAAAQQSTSWCVAAFTYHNVAVNIAAVQFLCLLNFATQPALLNTGVNRLANAIFDNSLFCLLFSIFVVNLANLNSMFVVDRGCGQ